MKIRILILLALLCTLVQKTSGQGLAIDPTQPVSAADVEVTEVPTVWNGHSVRTALEIPIRALIACTVGGCWLIIDRGCRISFRIRSTPSYRDGSLGFVIL